MTKTVAERTNSISTKLRNDNGWSPDYRRDPKTKHFCAHCQKDLKEGQPRRFVHIIHGGGGILHPSEEHKYVSGAGGEDLGHHPVGMDCARKIGLEWTSEKKP